VGLVLGQHHRASGQVADLLLEVGDDLVAVGIALGNQAGRRQQATSRTRLCRVRSEMAGRPSR
jgi:hypothetical protein